MTNYYVGIDGGGSSLRVVIVDADLRICAESTGESANPGVAGHDEAAHRIQAAIRGALAAGGLSAESMTAVGIGVAGAAAAHSAGWLQTTLQGVLPQAQAVLSSDIEIALVGAHGSRSGVLILAGTGSVAGGISTSGDYLQIGGWGYLIGDEGSGFWIGREALRAVSRADDGRSQPTALTAAILSTLGLCSPPELIPWLYGRQSGQAAVVAALAPLVLDQATAGDAVACAILDAAADELALLSRTLYARLDLIAPKIAFAGGLLHSPNPLSERLCTRLGLSDYPRPRYSPVVGAALLARLAHP